MRNCGELAKVARLICSVASAPRLANSSGVLHFVTRHLRCGLRPARCFRARQNQFPTSPSRFGNRSGRQLCRFDVRNAKLGHRSDGKRVRERERCAPVFALICAPSLRCVASEAAAYANSNGFSPSPPTCHLLFDSSHFGVHLDASCELVRAKIDH